MYSLTEHRSKTTSWLNDVVVCFIFMASIASFIYGWQGMHSVFNGRDLPVISLDYHVLPYYTLRTTMRLVIGLFYSMLFSIVFAAGSKICTDEKSYFALCQLYGVCTVSRIPDFHYRLFPGTLPT